MTTEIFEVFLKKSELFINLSLSWRLIEAICVPRGARTSDFGALGRGESNQSRKNILENSAFSAYRTNHHPRKYKKYIYYNNRNINIKKKNINIKKNEDFISFLVIR